MTNSLSERVAIVTGATYVEAGGLNIGGSIALTMARRGASVVLADIDHRGAEEAADRINDEVPGARAIAVAVDVRVEEEIAKLTAHTIAEFGRINVVVNNAGVFRGDDGLVGDLGVNVWDDVMAVNARGPMLLVRHALPHLLEAGGGVILNTSSTHSLAGDGRLSAYGASKAALNALTTYVATQYGKRGIRCNAICPGSTTSPPVQRLQPAGREIFEKHTLNSRLTSPAELASVYAFLASDEAFGINGMVLRVDGGLLAHQPFVADFASSTPW
jgi:NAD(P)-dependent dehydrogenase (short-subunit alcohol dehydrogenase family)